MGYINRHKVFFAVQRQVYPANFQEKTITPNTFQREITPDVGYDALSKVKLNGILVDAHTEIESQVDSDIKYKKTVPAGALQYAGLNKVGGMSYKFNQLAKPLSVANWQTENGASANYDNGVCTLSPNAQYGRISQYFTYEANHKLLVFGDIKLSNSTNANGVSLGCYGIDTVLSGNNHCEATTDWQHLSAIITATTESAENRIIITDSRASDWGTIQIKNIMCIDLTTIYGAGNEPTTVAQFKARFNKDYYEYTENTLHHSLVTSIVSNETLNIPAQVQLLNGYGMGVNADCYNYIDFEGKKFIRKTGIYIFTGNEDWHLRQSYTDLHDNYYCDLTLPDGISLEDQNGQLIIPNGFTKGNGYSGDPMLCGIDNDRFYVSLPYGAEPTTYFTNGVVMLYEVKTPVETDISEYITQDTLDVINTITFNNEYEQAVPSEINYLIEV